MDSFVQNGKSIKTRKKLLTTGERRGILAKRSGEPGFSSLDVKKALDKASCAW